MFCARKVEWARAFWERVCARVLSFYAWSVSFQRNSFEFGWDCTVHRVQHLFLFYLRCWDNSGIWKSCSFIGRCTLQECVRFSSEVNRCEWPSPLPHLHFCYRLIGENGKCMQRFFEWVEHVFGEKLIFFLFLFARIFHALKLWICRFLSWDWLGSKNWEIMCLFMVDQR